MTYTPSDCMNTGFNSGSYLQLPLFLFTDPERNTLSPNAKILYSFMLAKTSLSKENGWIDTAGRPYILYTLTQIMDDLGCSQSTSCSLLNELESIGLIARTKQFLGKPSVIYVSDGNDSNKSMESGEKNKPLETEDCSSAQDNTYMETVKRNISYEQVMQSEDEYSRIRFALFTKVIEETVSSRTGYVWIGRKLYHVETVKKHYLKLTKAHLDYVIRCIDRCDRVVNHWNAYIRTALYNSVCTFDKQESHQIVLELHPTSQSGSEPELDVVRKSNSINKDKDLDINKSIYPSIYESNLGEEIDRMDQNLELIKKNLLVNDVMAGDYSNPRDEKYETHYWELCSLVSEMMVSKRRYIKVNGSDCPAHIVKERFMQLRKEHLDYVLLCLGKTFSKIQNIRSYLITALFNAPATMETFYRQHVNHLLYGC